MAAEVSHVPLFDMAAHTRATEPLLRRAFERVVASSYFILGNEVRSFEERFAAYCGVEFTIGVGNGTDALELALLALECGPGDEVITVANAGMYSTCAILSVGATPVYVDVESESMLMAVDQLQSAFSRRTKAVILTHLYGQLGQADDIKKLCDVQGVPLVEDCAQAHGAERDGRKAGAFGALACFSFYPTKNLGAIGDGGAVVTSDVKLAERLRKLRQYGWERKYHSTVPHGRNSRLDELQAAFLSEKLALLDTWNERRREIARTYSSALCELPLQVPPPVGADHVAHLYVVRSRSRDELREALAAAGIGCEVHYPVPDYRQATAPRSVRDSSLPVTEEVVSHILSLPCYPEMSREQIGRVIEAVQRFFG